MPRNGAGQFNLPQPPFVPLQTISSAAVNSDFSDIADALTGSLARDGQGGMTAVLPLANAGANFASDPDTGFIRLGANNPAIQAGGVNVVNVTATGVDVTGTLTQNGGSIGSPIGSVLAYAGPTAPTLWLLCDGSAKSRTTYSSLFAIIGTTYGVGDGSTTFNLPDLRGRAPFGDDNMGGTAANRITTAGSGIDGATIGASGGEQAHTLVTGEIPVHSHPNTATVNDPGHSHPLNGAVIGNGFAATNATGNWNTVGGQATTSTTGITVTVNNANTGGGGAHNNMPPALILNYIIYAGA